MAYEAMWFVSWCGDTEREFLLKKEVLEHSPACGQLSGVLFEAECEQVELKWRDLWRVMKKGIQLPIKQLFGIPKGDSSII